MLLGEKFHQPWSEIDPTLKHGGIEGELEEGWVGPKLGDNTKTTNYDLFRVFRICNDFAAAMSMRADANAEGPPMRTMVEEVLRGINLVTEFVWDRTQGDSSRVFMWEHATPAYEDLRMRPIRYPVRNEHCQEVLHYLIGTQVEIAEMNGNAFHSGIDPSTAARILSPLITLKGIIIKSFFDLEVQGEISQEEIAMMMADKSHPGPTIVPPHESSQLPDAADVAQAQVGVPVLQWYPGDPEWVRFGQKRAQRVKFERIWQPEGSTRTTEDVAPQTPVNPPPVTPPVG